MNLLIMRKGDWSQDKRLAGGQIIGANGSKKNFTLLPNKVEKFEFAYGDKIICLHGSFLVIAHEDNFKAAHFTMFDAYWMPNREAVLTAEFLDRNRVVHGSYGLPGTNDRVIAGKIIR